MLLKNFVKLLTVNYLSYHLRHQNTFAIPFRDFVYSGTESNFLDQKLWELVPDNLTNLASLNSFLKKNYEMKNRDFLFPVI